MRKLLVTLCVSLLRTRCLFAGSVPLDVPACAIVTNRLGCIEVVVTQRMSTALHGSVGRKIGRERARSAALRAYAQTLGATSADFVVVSNFYQKSYQEIENNKIEVIFMMAPSKKEMIK